MKFINLLDDRTIDKKYGAAHGLSLYIEIMNTKILFDLGPNKLYKKNARKLNVDLSEVDYLFISHGHNDHGTGIKHFLKMNQKAKVYVSKRAFEDHVKKKGRKYEDIGIGNLPKNPRIHLIDDERIDLTDMIHVCDKVKYQKSIIPDSNLMLYENGHYIEDHFDHEIYLVLTENSNTVLVSGCSHKGIDNIVHTVEKNTGKHITHIVGGLHFSHYDSFNLRQTDYLKDLGHEFAEEKGIHVFACHCTGEDAYYELKLSMKENIDLIKTGSQFEI